MVANADDITQLFIYLIDSSDIRSVYALGKNMERQCDIVSFLLAVDDYKPHLI